jgi:hypothetical protein
MTRRRLLLLVAAGVCVAVAVFAALLAGDVGRWQAAFRAGDVEAADASFGARPSWAAHETVPFGLARGLLAVDDDLAFRRAVALFRRAHTAVPSFNSGLEGTSLRVQAEAALAHEVRTDDNRSRASVAANLLGVLGVADATTPGQNGTPIERSIFEFEDAIHLQPGNEQAKANLELVYQLKAPPNSLRGAARRRGRSHSGASATSPGHGY